ncbi:outer membrane protein assembly factor BamA [Neoehrlichia mikurensis]|uniref:Outer membrane protein assembly factor BamA n=1 Tax=Neoehrlichia mikurensis TaxID=89586 RepID=A0A9Q9BZE7_9RICK|nr:outer membrane protein assembly factor BamA [Neoehrlichia mikurensis]QXK91628.1 outer membrane protein assembly factor BamA [Neoehrlichia mikurensis]QXK92839.1 outer membrane protein assembly factor BamA [Neoehrlichia mikurensis]QXK93319.1 outer membrane protein assembly factor BamA [Neoehrlichia mikurensis]UTO55738.1 outer membrane protein assembly factor BamA [Neoehrlichia mikurensis]UTO56655.1 outer membrane protein assembly factor BamA [Neoehrlichia mikurensis]
MKYIVFIILLLSFSISTSAFSVEIKSVKVYGNERLDINTIYFYAKHPLKGEITKENIDQIIKNLYSTHLFSKVEINIKNNSQLIIKLKENPVVHNVHIKGNKEFSNKDLKDDILQLKALSIFTKAKLQQDIAQLYTLYQSKGKLGVKITYNITEIGNNSIDITININEGVTAKIKTIKFIGNKSFTSHQLKSIIASKETQLFKVFSNSTKYLIDRLMLDQANLYNFYTNNGFINFKIRSVISEVNDDYSSINIIFSLEEGNLYKFGTSTLSIDKHFVGNKDIKSHLQKFIQSQQGDIFNITKINNSVSAITSYLNNQGNLFATVKSEYEIITKENTVNVKYVIYTGNNVYINNINIKNNTRTLDYVIRRQLSISEGDVYNSSIVKTSQQNVLNLGFFEDVNVETQKINDNLIDLNFNLKEKGTGSFDIGAGFSSMTGLVGKISIQERNLLGTGKTFAFKLERSLTNFSSAIDLITPYFLDSNVSLGMGLFYSQQKNQANEQRILPSDTSVFSSSSTGFSTRLSYNITNNIIGALSYSYKYNHIYNVNRNASALIKEQEGKNIDSSVGYSLIYSNIDNMYQPRNGVFVKIEQSLSGIGGTLHYIKTEGFATYLHPILQKINNDIIIKIKSSLGYVFAYNNEQVKIGQRFFIGSNNIRGFSISGIGPRDKTTYDALGGNFYFSLINQVDFPIGLPDNLGIKGSLFIDAATLFGLDYKVQDNYDNSKSLRIAIGFGFSWKSPFGPVRIDFGFPIKQEKFDIKYVPRFSPDTGI